MSHAAKLVGDVGMSRDERSMLLGSRGDAGEPNKQLLGVLGQIRDIAEAVVDGRAGALWTDEAMNQLIGGVEMGLAQGWNEVVDAFTDAGRVLQSYEAGGRAEDGTLYLIDAYDLLCTLVSDSMSGNIQAKNVEKWRARYAEEVSTLQASGLELVSDDYESEEAVADSPFDMPDPAASNIVKLRPQDDLPSLDELPPLDSVISRGAKTATPQKAPAPAPKAAAPLRVAKSPIEVAREAELAEQNRRNAAAAMEQAEIAAASGKGVQPSQTIVEFVDRICEELAGLSQHSADERVLSLEMIQGGVAALKREAMKDSLRPSAELCDEMMKACLFVSQANDKLDERFTDLAFGFCGVYVEAMNTPDSENVMEWRAECISLVEEWAESEAAPAESTEELGAIKDEAVIAEPPATPAPAAKPVQAEIVEVAAPKPAPAPMNLAPAPAPVAKATPAPTATVVSSAPAAPKLSTQGLQSADLFARAQEALARGDGEAAKVLALQAAAMIAETEVDKAETRLRDAELRLKANVSATEEARSEVKHTEKLVMNAASDVAAGETNLGIAKSQTAKMLHELQESQAEVAEIDRQIAELMARREEQLRDVDTRKIRVEEAKGIETSAEGQLDTLRDSERESRKSLEAGRQRVKDHQRITAEIETEMERARETLSRQRGSLADIMQTINRPEPIKTSGTDGEGDSLLF